MDTTNLIFFLKLKLVDTCMNIIRVIQYNPQTVSDKAHTVKTTLKQVFTRLNIRISGSRQPDLN